MGLLSIIDYLSLFIEGSVIDYPRKDLPKDIWNVDEKNIKLNDEISNEILDIVYSSLDDLDLPDNALKDIFIYGSILTNRYTKTTDVDARIVLDPDIVYEKFGKNITGDTIFDILIDKIHNILLGDTQHPLNCTVVIEGEKTELGQSELGKTKEDPVYDVLKKKIVVSPYIYEEYDPDDKFEEEKDEAVDIMDKLDKLIQETRVDTLDYNVIQDAIGEVKNPDKLIKKMENKLKDIEKDIAKLVGEYEKIKKERDEAYDNDAPGHEEKGNIISKYLERYKYLNVLRNLKRIFKDGVEPEEVEDIENVIGV